MPLFFDEAHRGSVAKAYDRVRGYNWRYEAGFLKDDPAERETVCKKVVLDSLTARGVLKRYIRERA